MKKATCKYLQGPCDEMVTGNTPEEMGENCKKHVMEQMQAGDVAHKAAVQKWQHVDPEEQKKWFEEFSKTFDSLSDA